MNTEQIYLSLLRAAIWGQKEDAAAGKWIEEPVDWVALIQLCMRQGTAPLVFNQILKLPDNVTEGLQTAERMQMKAVCAQNMMSQERLRAILVRTWKAFQSANGSCSVTPILLKGFGLACLYPEPWLRAWGDLDIYVGPKQYHEAAAILRDAFPEAIHHDEEWEELKHYCFVLPGGDSIEMHRRTIALDAANDKRIFYPLEEAAASQSHIQEELQVRLLEPKFNLLFTFMHCWEHFFESGVGYKQLCDVALLAHDTYKHCSKEEIEDYLKPVLHQLKLMLPWQMVGYVLITALHLPKDEWPLYVSCRKTVRYGKRLYERVMQEGLCRPQDNGDSENRYEAREKALRMNIIARKWLTLRCRFKTVAPMWHYAPRYTAHRLCVSLMKGVRRTIKGEGMVMY